MFAKVRKLPICGQADSHQKFQWPSETELRGITLENLAESKLQKFEWHVSGSIWSIQLTMSDGRTSGHIGSRNKLDGSEWFKPGDKVTAIEMLHSPEHAYC